MLDNVAPAEVPLDPCGGAVIMLPGASEDIKLDMPDVEQKPHDNFHEQRLPLNEQLPLECILKEETNEPPEAVASSSRNHVYPNRHQQLRMSCSIPVERKTLVELWELAVGKKLKYDEPAPCSYCSLVFKRKRSTRTHIKRVHMKMAAERPHQCPQCGKSFVKAWDVKDHIFKTHTRGVLYCPIRNCGFAANEVGMKYHLRKVHKLKEDPRQHKCEHCGRRYQSRSKLLQHFEAKHRKSIPAADLLIACPYCPVRFSNWHRLRTHKALLHRGSPKVNFNKSAVKKVNFSVPEVPPPLQRKIKSPSPPPILEAELPFPLLPGPNLMTPPVLFPVLQLPPQTAPPPSFRRSLARPKCKQKPPSYRSEIHISQKLPPAPFEVESNNDSIVKREVITEPEKIITTSSSSRSERSGGSRSWNWLDREIPRCDICGKSFQQKSSIKRHKWKVHGVINDDVTPESDRLPTSGGVEVEGINQDVRNDDKDPHLETLAEVHQVLDELLNIVHQQCEESGQTSSSSERLTGIEPKVEVKVVAKEVKEEMIPLEVGIINDEMSQFGQHRIQKKRVSRSKKSKKGSKRKFDNFQCSYCRKQFSSYGCRWSHERLHLNDAKYECTLCSRKFITPHKLYYHKKHFHNYHKSHTSSPLSSQKKQQISLSREETQKSGDEPAIKISMSVIKGFLKPCVVRLQRLTFAEIWEHTEGKRIRSSSTSAARCPICSFECTTKQNLLAHLKRVHSSEEERRYRCSICDKKFTFSADLKRHHFRAHTKGVLRCPVGSCSRMTKTESGLNEHLLRAHNLDKDPREHKCNLCGRRYLTKATLLQHLKRHQKDSSSGSMEQTSWDNESPVPSINRCHICHKIFIEKVCLVRHKANVHGVTSKQVTDPPPQQSVLTNRKGVHRCNICSRVFTLRKNMIRHKVNLHQGGNRNHHAIKPQTASANQTRSNHCNICDQTFAKATDLVRHMVSLAHFNQTAAKQVGPVHQCNICGKGFTRPNHLVRHKTSVHAKKVTVPHPPPRKHKCNICGKGFSRSHHVVRHKASVHAKKDTVGVCTVPHPLPRRKHQCNICKNFLTSQSNLRRHKIRVHKIKIVNKVEIPNNFSSPVFNWSNCRGKQCPICHKMFTKVFNLQRHMVSFHLDSVLIKPEGTLQENVKADEGLEEEDIFAEVQNVVEMLVETVHEASEDGVKDKLEEPLVDKGEDNQPTKTNKNYPCAHCGKVFPSYHGRWVHEKLHVKSLKYKCPVCLKMFVTPSHLYYHKKSTHHRSWNSEFTGQQPKTSLIETKLQELFNLKPCVVSIARVSAVHLWEQTSQAAKKWVTPSRCPFCKKDCSRKDAMRIHISRVHVLDEERIHKCRSCDRKFSQACDLKHHIFLVHTKGILRCPVKNCGHRTIESALQAHLLQVHNMAEDPRKHKCEKCRRRYLKIGQLFHHVRLVHGTSLECDFCRKIFSNKFNVQRHMRRVHPGLCSKIQDMSGVDDVTCILCHKRFSCRQNVQRHMVAIHGKDLDKGPIKTEIATASDKEKKITKADITRTTFKLRFAHSLIKRSWRIRTRMLNRFQKRLLEFRNYSNDHDEVHVQNMIRPYQCKSCELILTTRLKLKQHICERKDKLASEERSPQLWEKIAEDLEKKQKSLPLGGKIDKANEETRGLPAVAMLLNDSDRAFLEMICKLQT